MSDGKATSLHAPGLLITLVLFVAACGSSVPVASPSVAPSPRLTGSPSEAASACEAQVDRAAIPDWAREGFSGADPTGYPHVTGRKGEIIGVLFGDPLTAPPSPGRNNKILWIARHIIDASDLEIGAQRMDGAAPVGAPVARSVQGGPGPSIIDLPEAGCWRLTLSWGGTTDTLDLEYVPPVS